MSFRGLFPPIMATVLGVVGGIMTFGPAFQERELQKTLEKQEKEASNYGEDVQEIPIPQGKSIDKTKQIGNAT